MSCPILAALLNSLDYHRPEINEGKMPDGLEASIRRARAALARSPSDESTGLRNLLREARQYVSDAGDDEDGETQHNSAALLEAIDLTLLQTGSKA